MGKIQSTKKSTRCKVKYATHQSFVQKQAALVLSATVLLATVDQMDLKSAHADISGLTPCAASTPFSKRKNQELKELKKRMKKYEPGSDPAIAIEATMARTEKRFEFYGRSGLLCGNDGLPHLIADPGFALKNGHAGDIFIPTLGFLYFAGWLGHSGRLYLEATQDKKKEVIIDVSLALGCLTKAFGWPFLVSGELTNGTLLKKDSDITVSPR